MYHDLLEGTWIQYYSTSLVICISQINKIGHAELKYHSPVFFQ